MKTIPVALQTHFNGDATTTAFLCRMATKAGTVLGFTSLDADVTYDDGNGPILYRADTGFQPDRMQQTADLSVGNTDLHGWLAENGITEAMIRAGFFDYARIRIYRVNYLDLAAGHEIVATGTAGQTKFEGQGWSLEFRSLRQQLKQPVCQLYSRTCRAIFGDAKCGEPLVWVNGAVTAVDDIEPDRLFTAAGLTQADDYFVPGVVEWLTGQNAGAQVEVDGFAAGVADLTFNLPYAIEAGDTFRIRQDCDKTPAMCKGRFDNLLNFRGEPFIPTDGGTSMVPGAEIVRA